MKLEPISKNFVRLLLYTIISIACLNPLMSRDFIFIDNSNPNPSSFLTSPTIIITSSDVTDGSLSNDGSISLTFTSSESTTDFIESDITVSGGSISSFSGSGTTYNATFTPSSDGATTIDVAANAFTDSAGNGNTAASQFNWTYDGTPPTIVISSTVISDGSTVNNSSVVFNFEASESSSNFGQSDITVNGGTITGFSGGGTNYSATFTPSLDGAKTIQIVSGAFTDSAGNSNTPSNIFSFTFDSTPPTIDSISSSSGDGFYGEDEQIAVRIDFSEPVSLTNGLLNIVLETGANDRVVSIGSSNITSVTSATGTYTIISGDNSTNLDATQVNLSSGQLVDIAGNEMSDFIFSNNISSSSQIVIDTTPPTMDITAQVGATQIQEGSTTNDTSINLIFTFSENVKNFDVSDVIVSGGNISSFTKVSDSEFNAIYTPVGDGLKTIQVSSTSYNDFANNENSTDSSFNWNYESTTYPTIQIAEQNGLLSDGSLSSSTTLTFIFTASEDIKGFDENDIQIIGGEAANGTFSNFLKLSDKLYRITFSPTSDGDKTIFIPQGSYSDLFDYQNAQASQFSWVHDGTPPTVTSFTAKAANNDILNGTTSNDSSINLTISTSENILDFDISDLNVSPQGQGSFSLFQVLDSQNFKVTFTPSNDNEFTLYVLEDSFIDSAGNRNNSNAEFNWSYDGTSPTISISSPDVSDGATTNEEEISLIFNADEPIIDFSSIDISLSSGSISNFSGSGSSYSATFLTNGNGDYNIEVGSSKYTDVVGNSNQESSSISFSLDNSSPSIDITSTDVINGSFTNDSSINLTFTSNVPIIDFASSDIVTTGGTITSFTGNGNTFTAVFVVNSEGLCEISISSLKFSDTNGNLNTVESLFSFNYDNTSPTISISSADVTSGSTTNDSSISLAFTLSEPSTNFDFSDITTTGGSIGNFAGSGSNYSATFTPSSDGLTLVEVSAGKFTDSTGNSNSAASPFSWTYDSTSPTISISSADVTSGSITNDNSIALDFSISESIDEFLVSDISVTGGTLSSFSNSGLIYSAIFTPSSDGLCTISIGSNNFYDDVGNGNSQSNEFVFTYDGTLPSMTIVSDDVSEGEFTNNSPLFLRFNFTEPVVDFDIGDFEIINGTISNLQGTQSTFSANFTPQSDGTCTIRIVAGKYSDNGGNLNSTISTLSFNYDITRPTISISSTDINNGETTNISNISLDFISSEDTSNFDDGNITVNGGTIAGFSGSSSEYSAEFSSNSFGEKNIQVLENSFSDISGNQNTTSNTFSWIYDAVAPVLNLNDPLIVEVEAGTTYDDPGYVVSDDFDISVDVQISGDSVDLTTLGDYNVIYTATDNAGNQTQKQRVVRVNDTTPPVITLVPETETVYLNVGDSYSLPNAFLSDNHDDSPTLVQTPTLPNTAIEGTYELYWVAKDSNDNATSKYITVVVGSPPVVTITPPNPYQIPLGDSYQEWGASAISSDNEILAVSIQAPENLSTDTVRSFSVLYSATDSSGRTTTLSRTVNVVDLIKPILSFSNPSSSVNGSELDWEVNTTYIDPNGVDASDNYDVSIDIVKTDLVDTSSLGQNFVYFDAQDSSGNSAQRLIRTVNVVDTTPPSVSLNGLQIETVTRGSLFNDLGVSTNDNYDASSQITTISVIRNGANEVVSSINTNLIDTYTITYSARDSSGNETATENQVSRTVIIAPRVDATATPNPACFGDEITLGSTQTDLIDGNGNPYSFEWTATPDLGVQLGTNHIITATVTQNTVFTINVYNDSDELVATDFTEVEVNPLPIFNVSNDLTICEGDSLNLGDGIVEETGFTYQWTSLNGYISNLPNPPPHTPSDNDTFTLTVTSDSGCQETKSFDVDVVERPIISFSDSEFNICEGENFVITNGVATVQFSDNYQWSAPSGYGNFNTPSSLTPIFTPTQLAIDAGAVTLTLTATDQNPCTGSLSESITLNITPLGNISLSPLNSLVCASEVVELDIIGSNYDLTSIQVTPASSVLDLDSNKIFYTPSSEDINRGYIDIEISANPLSPCLDTLTSPVQRISITPEAEVSIANSPLVLCYNPDAPQFFSLENIGVTILNADSFTWEDIGGGGTFSAGDATDPSTWSYQPGNLAIDNGNTQLKLTVSPISPCSPTPEMEAFLSVIVDQNPNITVSSGEKILCEGVYNEIGSDIVAYEHDQLSSYLWSGGDGDFVSNTSKFPFYRPGPTDLSTGVVTLTVTLSPESGGCSTEVTQSIEFVVNKSKIVNLGSDVEMCEADVSFALNGDFITDSNSQPNVFTPTTGITWEIYNGEGDGTFNEATSLNPLYTPGVQDIERGQVTLQMTYNDGSCNDVFDTLTLNIIRTPFADLGSDISICSGESTVITQADVRPVGGTIQWSIVPDASGVSLQNDTSLFPTLVADDTASGTFELKLTINPEDVNGTNCGNELVETIEVSVISLPEVSLTGSPVVCEGDDFTFDINQIAISTTNQSGYIWSTTGDGTFDGPSNATSTLERPTYSPGPEDIANGNVDLQLDVLPISPCPSGDYFDTINLQITKTPSIQGPNEIDFCKTNPLVVDISSYLSIENENSFTYQWTSSSGTAAGTFSGIGLSTTYTPSTFDINRKSVTLSVTATEDSCNATDSKDVTIYFVDVPEVDAGPEEVILCEDEISYQTNGSYTLDPRITSGVSYVWSTSGDGEFSPSNTETDPIYIPGPNDRLNRKVDDSSVGVQLTFTLVSTSICEVEVQDFVELFFEPKPEVSLPGDIELCSDLSVSLSANVNEFVDESSYFWSTSGDGTFNGSTQNSSNDSSPTYFPGPIDIESGSVTITVGVNGKNACSSTTVQDSQIIKLIPQPTANAGPDTIVCETGGIIDIEGTVAEPATNYSQLEWTIVEGASFGTINNSNSLNPEFVPSPDAVIQGYATLLLTVYPTNYSTCNQDSGFCCGVATDTVIVSIQDAPVITINPDSNSICQSDSYTILPDQVTIDNIPSYSLEWEHNGTGDLTNFNSLTPTYTPSVDEVGNVVLTLKVTPDTPTICTGLDPIERNFDLTISPLPVVTAGDDVILCQGESYTTLSADVDFTTNFQWTIDGFGSLTPNSSSENVTYTPVDEDYVRGYVVLTLSATPEGDCSGKADVVDSFRITYSQPPNVQVIVGDVNGDGVEEYPSSFCGSGTYTFTSDQVVGENVASYNWETVGGDGTFSDPVDNQTPTFTPGPGDKSNGTVRIKVTAFSVGECDFDEFEFDLEILPEPTLDLSSSPTSVCIDSTINLLATTNLAEGDYNITWSVDPSDGLIIQGGNTLTPTFEPSSLGTMSISATLSSDDPCATQDITETITISVVGLPEITSFPTDDEICFDDRITISGVSTNEFVDRVEWLAEDINGNSVGTFSDNTAEEPLYTPESFAFTELNDTQTVVLTMTAYPTSPCEDPVNQSITLTLTPSPRVDNIDSLWGDAKLCPDENLIYKPVESADFSYVSSFTWSSSGSGDWFDVTTPHPSYQPSEDEIDAGQFTLSLTLNGTGVCDEVVYQKIIQIVQTPEVSLSDIEVCHPVTPFDPVIGFELSPDLLINFAPAPQSSTGVEWSTNSVGGTFSNVNGDPLNNYSTLYFPTSEDYINGEVIIMLTAYPESPCESPVTDSMILTLTEQPTVNLGGPYTLCEDETSIQLDGSQINGTGLTWSTDSNGVFQDTGGSSSNLGNAIYEIGSEDYDNQFITLKLTAGGQGVCGPITETLTIPIIKNPTLEDVVGDVSLCIGEPYVFNGISIANYSSYSWTTTGKGIFNNKTSAVGGIPTYTPDPNDLDEGPVYFDLIVSANNPCTEQISYRKKITYLPPVTVDLGESFEFCEDEGSSFTIDATVENESSLQWSIAAFKGTGTLTNPTSSNVEYTPSNEDWEVGSVTLQLTVQPQPLDICGAVTEQIVIDLIGKPTVEAGESDIICLDETYNIEGIQASNYDLFVWQHNGEGTITTNPSDPTDVQYLPSENDEQVTLTLTLTNQHDTEKQGGCDMVSSDTVILNVSPKPTSDAGSDQTVCEGEIISLNGVITNSDSSQWVAYYNDSYNTTKEVVSGTFSPVDSVTTTFTPASDLVYTSAIARGGIIMELTAYAQNSCGEAISTSLVTFDSKPVISAGIDSNSDGIADDIEACEGDIIELSMVSPSVSFGTDYQWSRINGDGTFSGNITSSVLEPTYTPGTQDIDDGFVVLRLSAQPINACSTISDEEFYDEIRINITRQPTLLFTNDEFFICAGYEDEAFGPQPTRFEITGVSTNYSENISWRIISGNEGGDFEFGTNNLINPTFEVNPTFSGQIVLEAMVTAPGACDNRVDSDGDGDLNDEDQSLVATISKQITLNVSPIAELSFGNSISDSSGNLIAGEIICTSITTHTLDTNANFENIGDISWSIKAGLGSITSGGETLTPTYTPGVGEMGDVIFVVTADAVGDCNYTIKREFTLRIVGEPNVSFNPIGNVCSNEDIIITGVSSNSSSLSFESTGTGGIFYDPLDPLKSSDPSIAIAVADQSNYSFTWRYSPSESDLLNPDGISIIVRATPLSDSNCGEDSIDVLNITFSPAPEVSVMLGSGPHNVSICENDTYELNEASVTNSNYYSWTSSGSGEFIPSPESENPTYVPSDLDRQLGNPITLTLTAQGLENCQETSDSLILNIESLPYVEIPNSTVLHCEENNLNVSELNVFAGNYDTENVIWSSSSSGQFIENTLFPLQPVYQINESDKAAGEVTLFVRVYGDGKCSEDYDEDSIVVELSTQAKVSYLVNGTTPPFLEICEGEESITLSGTNYTNVDIDNGIIWSHNGSGYFDQSNIEQPTYFPDEADFITGTVTLSVNVSNSGECPANDLSIDLKLIKQPSIIADQTFYTVCYQDVGTEVPLTGIQDITNYSDFQWSVNDGQGNFQDPSVQNPIYIPGGNDFEGDRKVRLLLTVYPETGCNFTPITQGFEIEFVPQVVAYAGLGGTICSDEQFQISGAYVENAASWVWSNNGGGGSFNNPNLLNPIYTPSQTELDNARLNNTPIKLTLTAIGADVENDDAENCLFDEQSIYLNVESDIEVYAGPDAYLCTDENFIQLNGQIVQGNPVLSWRNDFNNLNENFDDPTSVTPKYYPTQEDIDRGFVTLKVTGESQSGCSLNDFDKVTITFVPAVDALDANGVALTSAGEDDSVCAGDTYIVTDAFINEDSWETVKWTKVGGLGSLFNINSLNPEYRSVAGDDPTVTLTMTVTSKQEGCLAEEFTYNKILTVTGNLVGTGQIVPSTTDFCEGSQVSFGVENLIGAVDYEWNIPNGSSIVSGDGTQNIIVSFDSYSQNENVEITVRASNSCPGQSQFISLPFEVKAKPELLLTTGNNDNQVLCYNEQIAPISYSFAGGVDSSLVSIEWFESGSPVPSPQGISFSVTSNSFTIEGTNQQVLTNDTVYSYNLKSEVDGCSTLTVIETGSIKLSASPSLSLQNPGTNIQNFCEGSSLNTIQYTLENGADNVQFLWTSQTIPNGLTLNLSSGIYSISGTPDAQDASSVFTYQIIPVNSVTGCQGTPSSGSITVNASSSLVPVSIGLENQSICESQPFSPIQYTIGNAVSSINLTWEKNGNAIVGNPPGVGYSINSGVLTIAGSVSENISSDTTYDYTINTTGGLCGNPPVSGSLTVSPGPRIQPISSSGSISQIKCEGDPIDNIVFEMLDGAVNPSVTGLPVGVSYTIDTTVSPNLLTISGVLDSGNTKDSFNYTVTASGSSGGCTTSVSGVITISREDILVPASNSSQVICEGAAIEDIIFEYSGGAIGATVDWTVNSVPSTLPAGLIIGNDNGVLTISGTPLDNYSSVTDIEYTVTTVNNGCSPSGPEIKGGVITVTPRPEISPSSGQPSQTLCEDVSLTPIVFDTAFGATNVDIVWDINPPGITHNFDSVSGKFTIEGTPTAINNDSVYNYTLTAVNVTGGCESNEYSGSITVLDGHKLQLLSGSATTNQIICEGDELSSPIIYEFGGGSIAARVNGLPPGINYSIADNKITISGASTFDASSTSTNEFDYEVETLGPTCNSIKLPGKITIVPNPIITPLSGPSVQTVCEGEEIIPVKFNTYDGAQQVQISWDTLNPPQGIVPNFDTSTGEFTLSGSPINIDQDTTYNYTLKAVNLANGCVSSEQSGSITVSDGHELKLLSGTNSTDQIICEGGVLPLNVVYEFGGAANSARVTGLPQGIGWVITGNILTISGTATENINSISDFDFEVESLGNNCESEKLQGKITINPDSEIELSSTTSTTNQLICEGDSIDPITYSFGGGTSNVVVSGLPPGVTYTPNPYDSAFGAITITGSPTQNVSVDTPYNYTVRALNNQGCDSPELSGVITVQANAELSLLSSTNTADQTICVDSNISDIRIRFKNSSIPAADNLPSGLSSEVVGSDVLRIYGSVSVGGQYTFDVIGTNTNGCQSTAVTIDLNVVPDYSINTTKVVTDMNDPSHGTDVSLVKNISCYGNRDGEIQVNLSNITSGLNYIYSWNGPLGYTNQTQSNHIKNLQPGNYTVSVFPQGNSDCPVTESFTIIQPLPTEITTSIINPVSCTGFDDGLISVSITGGNPAYYKNYIWEKLDENQDCVTYTIRLRDSDFDGIFDIEDADIDNDGTTDAGKIDRGDGRVVEVGNPNFIYSTVSYRTCDGTFITDVKQSLSEFSANGEYQICAVPNTVATSANLDHDQDPLTDDISSVVVTGGVSSCSSGSWEKIDRLKGTTYADNLTPGLYRLSVVEGPDISVINNSALSDLENDPDVCISSEIYELPKDKILYGSVRVDDAYCTLSGGYVDIDINQSAGSISFFYNGVRVPNTDVDIIAAEFGINTYRVLIAAPVSNATFRIENANGCGVVVSSDLLDPNVLPPVINYTSPELVSYGTISERSNILFTLANNVSYSRVEWDFGDASPVVIGERVSHQYFADGTYTVTVYVYNASGCFTSATQEIVVGKGYTILMPNAFSPNGDNINEIIGPVFTGLKAVDFFVYNKQGILIYEESVSETNLSENGLIEIKGWDGTNSDPASKFYIYKILGVRLNDEVVSKTGTIFLIE